MLLSSAYITYFSVVLAWICGSWAGLRITFQGREMYFALLALGSIYLAYFLANTFPFQMRFLPLYILLVISSSIYAGYFFRTQRKLFAQVKYLFFWENLGFIFGLISSFLGFILIGKRLILFGPLAMFSVVLISFFLKDWVKK
jgi:hypothetical protein